MTSDDLRAGMPMLLEVIRLMPRLAGVILCGRKAQATSGLIEAAHKLPVIQTFHLANRSYGHSAQRAHILNSFACAKEIIEGRPMPKVPPPAVDARPPRRDRLSRNDGSSPSVADHKGRTDARRGAIFEDLRKRMLMLHPGVQETPVKILVGYRLNLNFAEVHFLKDRLKIHLRPNDYVDPRGLVEHLVNPGFTMDRRFYISDEADIDYAANLIHQSFLDVVDR